MPNFEIGHILVSGFRNEAGADRRMTAPGSVESAPPDQLGRAQPTGMITSALPVAHAMRISSSRQPDCALIRPVCAETTLALQGLSPDQTRDLLHGRGLREIWRPGVRLTLDNLSACRTETPTRLSEIELADGKLVLRSGQPGTLVVEPGHALDNTLIPQSLALLMAQQLARSGLMMVHGAALRVEGLGILALGPRGSGKSVLSAAALAAGAEIVSDDWLLVGRADDGRFHAERLREFMMLRHGWAADRLLEALAGLGGQARPGRLKTVLDIERQPEAVRCRFPISIGLDRVWMLQRPRTGRTTESITMPCRPADALAGIIAATMPLLYGGGFPVEARALMGSARALIADLGWVRLATGLDLVDAPHQSLSRILASFRKPGESTTHPAGNR